MSDAYNEENDAVGATLAIAGLAVAAGLWKWLQSSSDTQDKDTAQRLFSKAYELEQQGMLQEAVQSYAECIKVDPSCSAAWNNIAWIYATNNYELDQAIAFANKAIQLSTTPGDRADYTDTLAEAYMHKGDFDEAITQFRQCISLRETNAVPPDSSAYFRLALCYQFKEDIASASKFFERALQLNPKDAGVHFAMGALCLSRGNYYSSIEHYQAAMSLARENSDLTEELLRLGDSQCLNNIGVAYYYLEDIENSRRAFELSRDRWPTNPNTLVNLASLAAHDKNKPLMRSLLEKGIPLIVDTQYFQQTDSIITFLITEPNFNEYRDIVLTLLYNNGKIQKFFYHQQLENWQKNHTFGQKQNVNISLSNLNNVTGLSIGPYSNSSVSGVNVTSDKEIKP